MYPLQIIIESEAPLGRTWNDTDVQQCKSTLVPKLALWDLRALLLDFAHHQNHMTTNKLLPPGWWAFSRKEQECSCEVLREAQQSFATATGISLSPPDVWTSSGKGWRCLWVTTRTHLWFFCLGIIYREWESGRVTCQVGLKQLAKKGENGCAHFDLGKVQSSWKF